MVLLEEISQDPPVGPPLCTLAKSGSSLDCFPVAPAEERERKPFFHADPVDMTIAPFGHTFYDGQFRRYPTEALSLNEFADITIIGTDAVLLYSGAVVPDTLTHLQFWLSGSAVESFQHRTTVRLRRSLPIARHLTDGPYCIGFNAAWRNYAHWLKQCVPTLVAFTMLRERVPQVKVVLPHFYEDTFQRQTLRMLDIGPQDVVEIGDHEVVTLTRCFVMNAPEIWNVPGYTRIAADTLARAALRKAAAPGSGAPRIYLHRTVAARRVANFEAVRTLAERYGFQVVTFEATPLAEQIATMRGTHHLIAEHGAGLANILFCEPRCRVLELFNPLCVQPAFWSLASCCDLEYGYVVGDHAPTDYRPELDWNSAYTVPLDRFEAVVRAMVGDADVPHLVMPGALADRGPAPSMRLGASGEPDPAAAKMNAVISEMIPREPPVGPTLAQLRQSGKTTEYRILSPEATHERLPFFFADPIDNAVARYGHLFADPAFRRYRAAEVAVHRLGDLTLIGADGVLLHAGMVIPDSLVHVQFWQPGSAVESFEPRISVRFRASLMVRRKLSDAPCFIGFSAGWRNYDIWMERTLPLLVAYVALRRTVPGVKIVLPSLAAGSFQEQTIRLFGIGPQHLVEVASGQVVSIADAYLMDTPDTWSVARFVRTAGEHVATLLPQAPAGRPMTSERVYLHREGLERSVTNFGAVEALLKRYGFASVTFENMPLAERVTLARGARLIIGEHGEQLANIMFCAPGALVLELFNPCCVQPAFWTLASSCEHDFGFIVGKHVETDLWPRPDWNASYEIPLDRLESAIRTMVSMASDWNMKLFTQHPFLSGMHGDNPGHLDVSTAAGQALAPALAGPSATEPAAAKVRFTAPGLFEIGDLRFALPSAQKETTPERALFYKDSGFLNSYIEVLPPLGPKRVFEFGICQGGSALFLAALLDVEKYVCIDISEPVANFETILANHPIGQRIRTYYRTPQEAQDQVRSILEAEFGDDPPDMIVDDASHRYELTKKSFEIAFPYLKCGGYYIIEDWSWAHWPENQSGADGWSDLSALSNLVLELVILLPSCDLIDYITVRQGYVILKKKAGRFRSDLFNIDDTLRTRGRHLTKI